MKNIMNLIDCWLNGVFIIVFVVCFSAILILLPALLYDLFGWFGVILWLLFFIAPFFVGYLYRRWKTKKED